MKYLTLTLLIFTAFIIHAQGEYNLGDTINQKDEDGKKTGYWIITGNLSNQKGYADTAIVEKGNYKRSRKEGNWIKYWPNGIKKSEVEWINGRPNGIFSSYYRSGHIEVKGNDVRYGPKNEVWRYYESGCLMQHTATGLPVSDTITHYFDDCNITNSEIGTVNKINTENKNQHEGWQQNYKPKIMYCDTCDTIHALPIVSPGPPSKIQPPNYYKSGYHKVYNDNAEIWLEGEFKNGRLYNGKYYIYDENGLLEKIEVYRKGKFVGNGVF